MAVGNFEREDALKLINGDVKDIEMENEGKYLDESGQRESNREGIGERRIEDRLKGRDVRRKYSIAQRDWAQFQEEGRLNVQTRSLIRGST